MNEHIITFAVMSVFTMVWISGAVSSAAEFSVVKDGKPAASIVLPEKENLKAKAAAAELQTYIEKISGAKLPLVESGSLPTGNLILVGRSSLVDKLGIKVPDELTNERREEGFIIHCRKDRLVLAGNDQGPYRGTEYAVYEFLNRLGVRWFMPGEYGEIVPKSSSISFSETDISEKPDFVLRNWWCIGVNKQESVVEEEKLWKLRNKMNPDMTVFKMPNDSSARDILPASIYFKTKPELFAMNPDGTRNPNMPNLSNPETVKVSAEIIKDYFRKNPNANSHGFAPDDGLPRDYDPQTLKLNQGFWYSAGRPGVAAEASTSEEWIRFVNNVTDEVHKEFPNVLISTNGYANRDMPPQGVKLNDKLIIMVAAIWSCTLHAYDDPACWQKERFGDYLQQWCKDCRNVWIYGYNYQMLVSGLTPLPETRKLARDFPLMKKWGVMGFIDETRNVWMEAGISSRYLRAKLEWNAGENVDSVLSDFYNTWYGPAAKPARAFYDAIENVIEKSPMHGHEDRVMPEVYNALPIHTLRESVAKAESLAVQEPYKTRVHVDRLILDHLLAYIDMNNADLAGKWDEAVKHGQEMLDIRKEISKVSIHLVEPIEGLPNYSSGVWYWTVTDRMKYYQSLVDNVSGKTGDLVALAPAEALFRTDPCEDGIPKEWYNAGISTSDWKTLLTTRTFYSQGYKTNRGYPYVGSIWYKLKVRVPAHFKDRKIMLKIPSLEPEAWVWVNGEYAGHREYLDAYIRPNDVTLDITRQVKIGETNDITIRVFTGLGAAQAPAGIQSRVVLYSPK